MQGGCGSQDSPLAFIINSKRNFSWRSFTEKNKIKMFIYFLTSLTTYTPPLYCIEMQVTVCTIWTERKGRQVNEQHYTADLQSMEKAGKTEISNAKIEIVASSAWLCSVVWSLTVYIYSVPIGLYTWEFHPKDKPSGKKTIMFKGL